MSKSGLTLSKLSRELSRDLGVSHTYVLSRGQALQAAGLLPAGKSGHAECNAATLDPRQALLVLLAVMSGKTGERAADAAKVYSDLSLLGVLRRETTAQGLEEVTQLPADAAMSIMAYYNGSNLLLMLQSVLHHSWRAAEKDFEVTTISIGGGAGNPSAFLEICPLGIAGSENVRATLAYGFIENPTGERPDDAPSARLDRFSQVPGCTLDILSRLFPDDVHRAHAAAIEEAIEDRFGFLNERLSLCP